MQTILFKAPTDCESRIKLEVPLGAVNQELEIVLVAQAVDTAPTDTMGYPIGYFEKTYGSFADEPLERNQLTEFDMRDELE
jgi:hypothetical protein